MRDIKEVLSPTRLRRFWAPPSKGTSDDGPADDGPAQILRRLRSAVEQDLGPDAETIAPILDLIEALIEGGQGAPLTPAVGLDRGGVEAEGIEGDGRGIEARGTPSEVVGEEDDDEEDEEDEEDEDEDEEDEEDDEDEEEGDEPPLEADMMGLLDQLEDLLEAMQIWKRRDLGSPQ